MAYLILENGEIFEGKRIGAPGKSLGELVFTTGMNGYLETLTDPSYAGQIIIQTFPLIGNYGVISSDFEGKTAVKGYVVRELCDEPSNFRSESALNDFLLENGIPGICGVDTRHLTRLIRENGVMNAIICDSIPNDLSFISEYKVQNAVNEVTSAAKKVFPAYGDIKYRVSLVDFGVKKSICENLRRRGCELTVYPADSSAEEILGNSPDGIVLSNGPGDPAENEFQIEQIRQMLGKIPMFGICLGHQMTAIAAGAKTYKLKFGHRGSNQPVKDIFGGRTFITSQNHGYAVDPESLPETGTVSFINANDGSVEGIDYDKLNCFTVQFHPEASAGPLDTSFLFDRFIKMISLEK